LGSTPTSDDPVILLNYNSLSNYNFNGGWNSIGTEIIFPLSPKHILYTKIGDRNKYPEDVNEEQYKLFQKIIIEHAPRFIFSKEPIKHIELSRPRIVDKDKYNNENQEWENWHKNQSESEKEYN
jgi:hypothetical protein